MIIIFTCGSILWWWLNNQYSIWHYFIWKWFQFKIHASYNGKGSFQFHVYALWNISRSVTDHHQFYFHTSLRLTQIDTTQHNVEQVTTNYDDISWPMMKILHSNLHFNPSLVVYPNDLQMLVQTLNNFVLSFSLSALFSIPMQWSSHAASTNVYNKKTKFVIFQMSSSKENKFTKKQFT